VSSTLRGAAAPPPAIAAAAAELYTSDFRWTDVQRSSVGLPSDFRLTILRPACVTADVIALRPAYVITDVIVMRPAYVTADVITLRPACVTVDVIVLHHACITIDVLRPAVLLSYVLHSAHFGHASCVVVSCNLSCCILTYHRLVIKEIQSIHCVRIL